MTRRSRREFITSGILGAGAVSVGLLALSQSGCSRRYEPQDSPYGRLGLVVDEISGLPLLYLPEGFQYRTLSWAGEGLSDGFVCPGSFDGMGIIAESDSEIRLIRNHETRENSTPIGPPEKSYDKTGGGTTTLVFDKASETISESWISLSGTLNNCAGGVTPWGTWLSCEEAAFAAGQAIPSYRSHWNIENLQKPHGYVFEVPATGIAEPQPLTAMGQFEHEAAVVDPVTGNVYMTEDQNPRAGLYRFVPSVNGRLAAGGKLEMMAVNGGQDMRSNLPLGQEWPVTWVAIDEPNRGFEEGEIEGHGVVNQGLRNGGTAFVALEGAIWDHDKLYFTSKRGGGAGAGCIFEYSPRSESIQLIYESPGHQALSGPDNIDVSPRGNLVICEDRVSSGLKGQCIASISKDGELHKFCLINPELTGSWKGKNLAHTARRSEWAGVCFSADGKWMFANIYNPGITMAITGPWQPDWM